MRVAIILLCVLLVGGFVCLGFWWKANAQDHGGARPVQSDGSTDDDEQSPVTVENGPAAGNGATGPATTPRPSAAVSEPDRRLLDMLASSDVDVRCEALRELGTREDADLGLLTEALAEDPSPKGRGMAARSLGRLKNREAIPDLLDALDDEDVNVRVWAITAFNSTLVGVRFPYNADAPREKRLGQIAHIRDRIRGLEAYWAEQQATSGPDSRPAGD